MKYAPFILAWPCLNVLFVISGLFLKNGKFRNVLHSCKFDLKRRLIARGEQKFINYMAVG